MTFFEITSILMVLTALFSYVNYRVLHMPTTIGVMFVALMTSLGVVVLGSLGIEVGQRHIARMLENIDFNQTLLHGMLSFLLFAGAMHIKLDDLVSQKWVISVLATVGVIASTFIVGGLTWLVLDLLGLVIGLLAYQMLKRVNNYQVEVIITLALVMGGYALADRIHTSGPIAIVVAGLLIGNHGRAFAMSEITRDRLDDFWELMDEILNALLFMLIGLEVLVMPFTQSLLIAGLLAIVITLCARWISAGGVVLFMRQFRTFSPGAVKILTWGGLRGGISVALALSIPPVPERAIIITITYIIVVFSIVIQGMTLGRLVDRIYPDLHQGGSL